LADPVAPQRALDVGLALLEVHHVLRAGPEQPDRLPVERQSGAVALHERVGSLIGPLFGAGIYLWVEYIVSGGYPFDWIAPYWLLVLGLVFVTVVVLFPEGIWGLVGDLRDRVATCLEER